MTTSKYTNWTHDQNGSYRPDWLTINAMACRAAGIEQICCGGNASVHSALESGPENPDVSHQPTDRAAKLCDCAYLSRSKTDEAKGSRVGIRPVTTSICVPVPVLDDSLAPAESAEEIGPNAGHSDDGEAREGINKGNRVNGPANSRGGAHSICGGGSASGRPHETEPDSGHWVASRPIQPIGDRPATTSTLREGAK